MAADTPRPERDAITLILKDAALNQVETTQKLLPLVYDELRRLAQDFLREERPDHTLPATALVHEAYLRLVDQTRIEWASRGHFFAVAAVAIRRILVDYARSRNRDKRGGGQVHLPLEEALMIPLGDDATDVLELHLALEKLARLDPDKERVVELRFFGGMNMDEIAGFMGVSLATVERHWRFGRAWLYQELSGDH